MNIFSNIILDKNMLEQIEVDNHQNIIKKGDAFFTTSSETPNEVGMSSVLDDDLKNTYLNSFCFGFRPFIILDNYFLGYILRSNNFRRNIILLAQGISRYNISKNKVMNLKIGIPLSLEQNKIGTIFKELDNLITFHQRKLDKLGDIKLSLIDKLFVQKNNLPNMRFEIFKKIWKSLKLIEVAKYRNGKAHENNICLNGKYIVVNSKFISSDGKIKKYSLNQLEPLYTNEIAFVLSDVPKGKAIAKALLIEKNNKYTLNQRVAGITPSENIYPYFFYILINRNRYFLKFDDGINQTNLSINDVNNFSNFYPEYEEQVKIGNMFKKLDNLITLHQRKP